MVRKLSHKSEKKFEVATSSQFLGLVSLLLAMGSMVSLKSFLALLAIVAGGLSVWTAMRNKEHGALFLGMAGMLIAICTIWFSSNWLISY